MISDAVLLASPLVCPLIGAIAVFFFEQAKKFFLLAHLALSIALTFTVFESGTAATSVGNWLAPYGIVLIADPFAALILTLSSLIFCSTVFFYRSKNLLPLLFFLQTGVTLSFISGDLFNLFVAFEIMLASSYVILTVDGNKSYLDNAYSYLSMNISASFLYLIAIAVFYGYTGTLNMAAIALIFKENHSTLALIPVFAIFVVLMIKGGIFPLYFWLPDSYPLLSSPLGALFGGILSKVGIYALFRLFLTLFPFADSSFGTLLLVLACLSMLLGVLGAVSKSSIKGILSYHILSQGGYMILGLSFATPLAVAGAIFFIFHNMVVKASLFLLGGLARKAGQEKSGPVFSSSPILSLLFLLQAFSLSGLPPLSGFWGKYLLLVEGVELHAYGAVAIAILTSFFTLFSMIKIWNNIFLTEQKAIFSEVNSPRFSSALLLTLVAVSMGLFAQKSLEISSFAAKNLLDNRSYIAKSLESGTKGEK